ncbi:hypothetical protein BV20DRAFT_1055994 [Pilatotrama ljubarskyi]|nr:hypothetical protein BV20DRAFT_1055994 [Pilatotrama ljubarskyi]
MSAEQMSPAQLATAADHLMAAKMFSLASCVMLFYDIAITFGDEVEKIWKQRFTGATVLWFLNRYLSPLGYIVVIVSFHDPSWSKATCQRYVLYPEVLKIFTATVVGLIFILRLYSIYSKRNIILYSFGALLVAELGVKIWAFTDGTMLVLPPGGGNMVLLLLVSTDNPRREYRYTIESSLGAPRPLSLPRTHHADLELLLFPTRRGDRIIYTWVAELVFDSVVFFATLYRTIQLYRRTLIGEALSLITVIMRDGIMYFAAIFVSNLVTVLIFIFAPQPDLKVINASFSTLITSLMVSRLMLNLRAEVLRRGPVMRGSSGGYGGHGAHSESYRLTSTTGGGGMGGGGYDVSGKTFESSIIGNLGAPVITFGRDEYDDEYDLYGDYDDAGYAADESRGEAGADAERGHPLTELGSMRPEGGERGVEKKPSLTAGLSHTHPMPKLLSKRRPRTADNERGASGQDAPDHTRSLPGQLVVQVTEEVVVVDEAPDPAAPAPRTPLSPRAFPPPAPSPILPVFARTSPPASPRSPSSPSTRSARFPSSPSPSPYTERASPPTSPVTPLTPAPRSPPRSAYPSRPPHSAGAAYPPYSPHAPDSPLAPAPGSPTLGHGQRPPRSAHGSMRRSWVAPPSWRLSLDRDREARRQGQGQGQGLAS